MAYITERFTVGVVPSTVDTVLHQNRSVVVIALVTMALHARQTILYTPDIRVSII